MIFKETQKFTQLWLYIPLIALAGIPVYGCYRQIILGAPFGSSPLPNWGLIVFALFMFAFIGLFMIMKLKTTITRDVIQIQFIPFMNRKIQVDQIDHAEIVDYGFVGGWGIRLWTKYGTVYNTRGNMGLAITLKDGKKLCIGTQQIDKLEQFLNNTEILSN